MAPEPAAAAAAASDAASSAVAVYHPAPAGNDGGDAAAAAAQHETGVLVLRGVVDIFEVAALHAAGLQALGDAGARAIRLDVRDVERLDGSAGQILCALKRDLETVGRCAAGFDAASVAPGAAATLTWYGWSAA